MEHNEMIDKITKEVMARLNEKMKGQDIKSESSKNTKQMTALELAGYIDHTLLKPEAVKSQFEKLCDEARKYKFKSVCVNSSWVPFVAKNLRGEELHNKLTEIFVNS